MKLKFDRDKFRVLFHKTKLTQGEFAYIIGKSQGAVSTYILGRCVPKEETLEKMAKALHCEVADLLTDVGGGARNTTRSREAHRIYERRKGIGCV